MHPFTDVTSLVKQTGEFLVKTACRRDTSMTVIILWHKILDRPLCRAIGNINAVLRNDRVIAPGKPRTRWTIGLACQPFPLGFG